MSDYLDEDVAKNMPDAYAAEIRHTQMMPLTRLEALIHVTIDTQLLSLIAAKLKQIVVPAVYSHLIRSRQINDKIVEMQVAKKSMVASSKLLQHSRELRYE
ncbi:MAG: hypothetical protein COC24_010280 [Alphaproteobacteria bacterium]|nr:hypothetical protein [Alphaproteobacteria bacterium]